MVLAAIWEKRNRRRHIAQGRALGLEEANAAWRNWLHRRESAAANGVPFNEPMPGTNRTPNPPPSHPA